MCVCVVCAVHVGCPAYVANICICEYVSPFLSVRRDREVMAPFSLFCPGLIPQSFKPETNKLIFAIKRVVDCQWKLNQSKEKKTKKKILSVGIGEIL